MKKVLIGSIIMKGIGAVIEIAIQVAVIHFLTVETYGTFVYYISLADIGFWLFFSGISKCNLFYCAQRETTISRFRCKYYIRYGGLLILILGIVSFFVGDRLILFTLGILCLETLHYDNSSLMLAKLKYKESIIGEYCLGRMVLLLSILIFGAASKLNIEILLGLYVFQYFVVIAYFLIVAGKIYTMDDVQQAVSVKKVFMFQYGDVLNGLISKAPVILQYLFIGAFEAGFVNIVALVRTLVAFLSGPTSKVFLPEFTRLYSSYDIDGIAKIFREVIHLQMMFLTAIGVSLIGFPSVILDLFTKELSGYSGTLAVISVFFLIGLSFGPCSGFMQMTSREKNDILIRSGSVVIMILTWIVSRGNSMFVLFGIGIQIICENIIDYIYVSRIFGKAPVSFIQYLWLWVPLTISLIFIRIFDLNENLFNLFIMTVFSSVFYLVLQLSNSEIRYKLSKYIIERKRKRVS